MAGAAWVAALLAAGCSKEGSPAVGWTTDPEAVRIDASVGAITRTNPLGTAEEQTKFNSGDKIAVAAVDNGAVKKTVKYQFDGSSSWMPVADESGATDYLLWDTPVTFRAWYPAAASGDEFTLPNDQSGASGSLADADFMTWSAEYKDDAAIPEGRKLSIKMQRQMALVTIVIDKIEDQFENIKDAEVLAMRIYSAHASVKRQPGGTFASEGDLRGISAVKHEVDSKTAFSAIVTPGEANENKGFLYVYIEKNSHAYNELKVIGIPAAEAGKHYTYKLIVGKKTVKIGGVTVEDWTTGGKLDGNFEAEVGDYSEWDGKKVTGTYNNFSGEGTSARPYLIQSATDLAGLAAMVNSGTDYSGKYFRLETDIDLMGHEWTPIGNRNNSFNGNFDGNGKVITNLTISDATDNVGLFGFAGGTIQNVVLRNASVASSSVAALLVGHARDGAIKSCKIDGVVRSDVYIAAGIVGAGDFVEISDCDITVDCQGQIAGGVYGQMSGSSSLTIKSCTVRGRILGGNTIGGIAGVLLGSEVTISGCKSYATLSLFDKEYAPMAGGIAGSAYYCKFEGCEVYGDIDIECENDSKYSSLYVGGAIGLARDATISNLKFEGTMNVKSIKEENKVGAVIGEVENSLTVSSECTYKKSGTGTFPPVGTYPDGFDTSILDKIKGI